MESPIEGQHAQTWTREGRPLHRHPREAGIPPSGAEQYVIVTLSKQRGDSRAERENDVHNGDCVPGRCRGRGRVSLSSVILAKRGSPTQGQSSASSQSPLNSASALRRKLRPFPCSSFSAAIRFAGFASETRVVAGAPSEEQQIISPPTALKLSARPPRR